MRITLLGGAITASILTARPGASAFALTPVLESALSMQKKAEEKEKAELEGQFDKKSQNANKLSVEAVLLPLRSPPYHLHPPKTRPPTFT